jgi:hypothetical protein
MGVVWVIEKSNRVEDSAAKSLCGDFAVRLFASIDSFQMLLRVNRRSLPDVLVIDGDDCDWNYRRLRDSLFYYMPNVPCVYIAKEQPAEIFEGFEVVLKPYQPSELSKFVNQVLQIHRGDVSRNLGTLRYKDIVLNFAQVECRVVPDGDVRSLPLKEAQLLKLFLERPTVCLPRAEIQKIVWAGVKVSSRTIDSHISRLRRRIDGADVSIQSVYGGGYMLC